MQVHTVGSRGAGAAAAICLQDGLLHGMCCAHQGGRDVSATGIASRDLRAPAPVLEQCRAETAAEQARHCCCPALPVLGGIPICPY